jgi:hypothetical protein
MIVAQRSVQLRCDAGEKVGLFGLGCSQSDPLPPDCLKPGTEHQYDCQQWARNELHYSGSMATALGMGGLGTGYFVSH